VTSDLELARLARPDASDAELVIELAERTLDELGLSPAIDHEIVASYRDIIRIDEADLDWSGHIATTSDGLVITVNKQHPRTRQRFTVFHEIMHTFLPGFTMQTRYRCNPGQGDQVLAPGTRDLEKLCDIGAAELLFPRIPFRNDLTNQSIDFELIENLATRYDASREATCRRIVDLNTCPTMLITFEVCCKPSRPHDEPALRVIFQYSGRRQWPYVPQYKSVPSESVFGRAVLEGSVDELTSLDTLTNPRLDDEVRVCAKYLPYYDEKGKHHMRVLALVTRHDSRKVDHDTATRSQP
jgi:Zn-dependent peptidase ImmA (M78 family)